MGLLDSAGSALDTASSMLGGPQAGAASAVPDVPPTFVNGESLGESPQDIGGAQPPNDQTVHDRGAPIEFIHVGQVHPDSSLHFVHEKQLDDSKRQDLPEGPGARAIMFRDALEREAILLGTFINCSKRVLKEKEDSEGGVGAALAMASALIGGGGGGGSSGPKSSDFDGILSGVTSAVNPINNSSVQYKLVHQAGINLQAQRAKYDTFRKKLLDPPQNGGGGGLLSQVSAIAGSLGPIGNIINMIQGIAFKAFDIYVMAYAGMADQREAAIESACHDMSLAAIKAGATPIFGVWFPKPAEQQTQSPSDSGVMGDIEQEVSDVKKKAQDLKDFLEGAPVDCPGTPFLLQAFSMSSKVGDDGQPVTDQPPKPPEDTSKPVIAAFAKLTKVDPLPGFLETIIKQILQWDADFLQAMFQKLMEREPTASIDEDAIFEAARKRLLQRMVDLLCNQVSVLDSIRQGAVNVQGAKVGPGHFLDEGLDTLNQKFGAQLDPVLHFLMKELADELKSARDAAMSNNSLTMEAYLGLMPYLLALMFRDTFFPMWDLLVKQVFATVGGPVGSAVNSAIDAMKKVKSVVDTARDWKKRGEAMPDVAQNALQRGVGTGDKSGNIAQDESDFNNAKNLQADRGSGDWGGYTQPPPPDKPKFPVSGRTTTATGTDIKLDEWNAVKPNNKWTPAIQ
jgi:hypothetical protein